PAAWRLGPGEVEGGDRLHPERRGAAQGALVRSRDGAVLRKDLPGASSGESHPRRANGKGDRAEDRLRHPRRGGLRRRVESRALALPPGHLPLLARVLAGAGGAGGAMSAAPIVSVLTPVHNGQTYLDDALGSVAAQTFGDWELLVLDNAST